MHPRRSRATHGRAHSISGTAPRTERSAAPWSISLSTRKDLAAYLKKKEFALSLQTCLASLTQSYIRPPDMQVPAAVTRRLVPECARHACTGRNYKATRPGSARHLAEKITISRCTLAEYRRSAQLHRPPRQIFEHREPLPSRTGEKLNLETMHLGRIRSNKYTNPPVHLRISRTECFPSGVQINRCVRWRSLKRSLKPLKFLAETWNFANVIRNDQNI